MSACHFTPDYPGIRRKVLVLYTVNCSAFAAREICLHFRKLGLDVDLVGNESCYDNQAIIDRLLRYATHPNVAGMLVVAHGCEFIQAERIAAFARERGRSARVIYGQHVGTEAAIRSGIDAVTELLGQPEPMEPGRSDILGLGVQTEHLGEAALDELAEFVALCVQQGRAVVYRPGVLTREQAKEIGTACPEYAWDLEELSRKSMSLRRKEAPCSCTDGGDAMTRRLLKYVRGVVKIARRPKGPGVWLLDTCQDEDLYKGYANATVLSDLLEFAACGAGLSVQACDRRLDTAVPVAPVLCCGFGGWQRDVEGTDPQRLLEAVEAAEKGRHLLCEDRVYQEHMIFRNIQIHSRQCPQRRE